MMIIIKTSVDTNGDLNKVCPLRLDHLFINLVNQFIKIDVIIPSSSITIKSIELITQHRYDILSCTIFENFSI